MDSFEKVLPKLVKLQLFSNFDITNKEDCRLLRTVYDNLTIKTFKAGQTIIREGENGDSFFILYSGEVLVSSMTPSGDSIALATVSDTQNIFFGETSIIGNDVRSATVTAKTQCNTLIISGKKFSQLCDAEPVPEYVNKVVA